MQYALRRITVNFNILKNDLKRKKSINVILLLFIILASMLMAGSVNVLYTTSTAIRRMMDRANVPFLSIFAYDNPQTNRQIEDWAGTSDKVSGYKKEDILIIISNAFLKDSKQIVPKEKVNSVLLSGIPKANSLVFDQNDRLMTLEEGEIAIPVDFHKEYDINIGDKITIHTGDTDKEFKVAAYEKDIMFGSDMIMRRFMLSDADFEAYQKMENADLVKLNYWGITPSEGVSYRSIAGEFGNKAVNVIFTLGKGDIDTSYMINKLVAIVMMIVSACLILISFLILRFTIVFTVQEDYREIGVMKAIGIRSIGIRRLYLIKYLAISLTGGLAGFFLSFLYSRIMLQNSSEMFITEDKGISVLLAAASSLLVVALSMFFCWLCTGKINRVSVMEAIHQGNTGERFSRSKKICLFKRSLVDTADFLSISDLVNGFKKFAILTVTFVLGTMLIILPLNIINTLKDSGAMMNLFALPPFDMNVINNDLLGAAIGGDEQVMKDEVSKIGDGFTREGYPIDFHIEMAKTVSLYTDNSAESLNANAWKGIDYSTAKYLYIKGSGPESENEIAISTKIAEYFGISVGDTITGNLQEETRTFIVTGLFQSMSNLGMTARLSEDYPLTLSGFSSIGIYGEFRDPEVDAEKAKEVLTKAFPDTSISTRTDIYNNYLGSTVKSVDSMKNLIVGVVLGIIFLITCLIVRMLIAREVPEIALLKSIGFRDSRLRRWQIGRIVIVLVTSIVIGTILAGTIGSSLVAGVFSMMGATSVPLIIVPLQVYVLYPALLLVSTTLAAAVSIGLIRKTQIWEINCQE